MAAKNETKNVITGGEVKPVKMVRNETSPVLNFFFFLKWKEKQIINQPEIKKKEIEMKILKVSYFNFFLLHELIYYFLAIIFHYYYFWLNNLLFLFAICSVKPYESDRILMSRTWSEYQVFWEANTHL